MDRTRFQRMKSLLERALELDEAERASFLDRECSGDEALRATVDRLLAGSTESERLERLLRDVGEALDPTAWEATTTGASPSPFPSHGAMVGPYRLREKIGEGGMGEVWVAEQTQPVQRRVALKIIKRGMDSDQIIARFEAERQALAMMDHPTIATVFDAGQTPEGRPFFVMEYIEGVPITEHCDRHALDTRARLELFVKVCEGVQHAHQKAVIHRDLKPSNILVSVKDGKAEPKIIDFGVAKATAQRLTEKTVYTELGVLIGTPAYMSPEQAEMTGQGVDTRTDVYALGVLLYELLTGVLPFDARELRAAGFDEIRRRIREVDPPRPSTRLTSLPGATSESSVRNRKSTLGALTRQIRGDLDWITMKGLEKDRTRRYGSASELAMDIGRYLRDEPVSAGPPSGVYRARKFVKRHKLAVVMVTLLVVVSAGFSVITLLQSRRVAREAATVEQVSGFLVGLFEVSNPSESRGNTITAREILDRGAEEIATELPGQPEVQARLMSLIGKIYGELGLYDRSEELLEDALELQNTQFGERHPDTLSTRTNLGITINRQGRYEDAATLDEKTLELKREAFGSDDPRTLDSMTNLANRYRRLGRYREAEALAREALEARRRVQGSEHPRTLKTAGTLAGILGKQKRFDEALEIHEYVLNTRLRASGADHPATIAARQSLGIGLWRLGRYDEAGAALEQAVQSFRRVVGSDHPDTLRALHNLAVIRKSQGRVDEAERTYREVLSARQRLLTPGHPETLGTMEALGELYAEQGRFDEAEAWYRRSWETRSRVSGPNDRRALMARWKVARLLLRAGRLEDAMSLGQESLTAMRQSLGDNDPETIGAMYDLALAYGRLDRLEGAESLYREAAARGTHALGSDHPLTLNSINNLANVLIRQGRFEEAGELHQATYEGRLRTLGEGDHRIAQSAINLARVAAVQDEPEDALDWLQRAVDLGCGHAEHMLEDQELQSLQDQPRFLTIVEQTRRNQKNSD